MIKHPVPDEFLTQIGDITVSFAMLDSHLTMLLWILIGAPGECGPIITSALSSSVKRSLIKNLYIEKFGKNKDYTKIEGFINRANEIEDERNKITHSFWGAGKNKDEIYGFKYISRQKGFKFTYKPYTKEELSKFVDKIKKLAEDILNFIVQIKES